MLTDAISLVKRGGKLEAHPAEVREKAFDLWRKGSNFDEVGAKLSIPPATIAGWSARLKWKARRHVMENGGDLVKAGFCAPPAEETPDTISREAIDGMSFDEKQQAYTDALASEAVRMAQIVRALPSNQVLSNADKIAKLDATARKALRLETDKPAIVVNVGFLAGPAEPKREKLISNEQVPEMRVSGSELPAIDVLALV